jgi:hypothetical protein
MGQLQASGYGWGGAKGDLRGRKRIWNTALESCCIACWACGSPARGDDFWPLKVSARTSLSLSWSLPYILASTAKSILGLAPLSPTPTIAISEMPRDAYR